MMRRFVPLVVLALAACSQAPDQNDATGEVATIETSVAVPVSEADGQTADYDKAQPGAGNEYSYIDLLALRDDDGRVVTDNMANVGGCSFTDDKDRLILTVGAPDDRTFRAIGVARPNGKGARKFVAQSAGDQYVWGGPVMVHDGAGTMEPLTLTVSRAVGEGEQVGIETRRWEATLGVSDPNGDRAPYSGFWNCGV